MDMKTAFSFPKRFENYIGLFIDSRDLAHFDFEEPETRKAEVLHEPPPLLSRTLFTFDFSSSLVPKSVPPELSPLPEEGDSVFVGDIEITLGKSQSMGAEGKIFTLADDSTKLIKILFSPDDNTLKKIDKLISLRKIIEEEGKEKNLPATRLALPLMFVNDGSGRKIGYLMRKFDAAPLVSYSFRTLNKLIPSMRTEQLVKAALSLTELTAYCHELGICLCDVVTPYNTLVDSEMNCYFCDLDSVQINDGIRIFPAVVGREDYLSPEHCDTELTGYSFIRTPADDIFALEVMLFEMLVAGAGRPYARKNGDYKQDLKQGIYIYPTANEEGFSEQTVNEAAVLSMHRIPRFVKEAFYNAFAGDGKHWREKERLTAAEWLELLERYKNVIARLPGDCGRIVSPAELYELAQRKAVPDAARDAEKNVKTKKTKQRKKKSARRFFRH